MHSLPHLIAYHRQRAVDCGEEIDKLVSRYNAAYHASKAQLHPLKDDDLRRSTQMWRDEQTFARDTASYLETMLNRLTPVEIPQTLLEETVP